MQCAPSFPRFFSVTCCYPFTICKMLRRYKQQAREKRKSALLGLRKSMAEVTQHASSPSPFMCDFYNTGKGFNSRCQRTPCGASCSGGSEEGRRSEEDHGCCWKSVRRAFTQCIFVTVCMRVFPAVRFCNTLSRYAVWRQREFEKRYKSSSSKPNFCFIEANGTGWRQSASVVHRHEKSGKKI
jgi:hypothetical protein